jgi:hypothetical protein
VFDHPVEHFPEIGARRDAATLEYRSEITEQPWAAEAPSPDSDAVTPVVRIMRSASSASQMSPLPKTGIEVTASLSSLMRDQSAWPEYSWLAVRAWSATACTPSSSAILPASMNVIASSSMPTRNFTVTGTCPAFLTAARTICR